MAHVTISRIRDGITDPDEMIVRRASLRDYPVTVGGSHLGVLYIKPTVTRPPGWLGFFGDAIELDNIRMLTASSSAVLLLQHEGTHFALPFGYGQTLINDAAEDGQFGLRVTLNAVDPGQLRSIDHRRLESNPRHVREQISRASGLDQFGIDVERDLLRAVTGTPTDKSFGDQLSGRERLTVDGDISIDNLRQRLSIYQRLAQETRYKAAFSFIDNIVAEKDPNQIRLLDAELVAALRAQAGGAWLAAPQILEPTEIKGVKYKSGKDAITYPGIRIEDYVSECGWDATAEELHENRLRCVQAIDDGERPTWPIYKCLVSEATIGGARWILSEGTWYRIDSGFLKRVEEAVDSLPDCTVQLPDFDDKDEPSYTQRVWRGNKSELASFDTSLIYPGGRTGVEVCDLYSRKRVFIHLKKADGSRVLSHLFNQGVVSAQLFVNETSYRMAVSEQLPSSHRWGDAAKAVVPQAFEIAYGLIARPSNSISIPFFSKVALRNAHRLLAAIGFKVTIARIRRS